MRTWVKEALVVGTVLSATVIATGSPATEWIGAAAVLESFKHAQIGFRLSEKAADPSFPEVDCHAKMEKHFLRKEALWFVYFTLKGAWPALVGVAVFLSYPRWRKYHLANRERKKSAT